MPTTAGIPFVHFRNTVFVACRERLHLALAEQRAERGVVAVLDGDGHGRAGRALELPDVAEQRLAVRPPANAAVAATSVASTAAKAMTMVERLMSLSSSMECDVHP